MQPTPSTRGPKVLVALGVLTVLLGVAVAVLGTAAFTRNLPAEVLDADGEPGARVLAVVDAGDSVDVDLRAGDHQVWLVTPRSVHEPDLDDDLRVTGPDGTDVNVRQGWLSGASTRGTVVARAVAGFEAPTDGSYRITAPPLEGVADGRLFVTFDDGPTAFVGGILGTIGAVLGGVFLGATGLGLGAAGGIWWYRRLHPPTGAAGQTV